MSKQCGAFFIFFKIVVPMFIKLRNFLLFDIPQCFCVFKSTGKARNQPLNSQCCHAVLTCVYHASLQQALQFEEVVFFRCKEISRSLNGVIISSCGLLWQMQKQNKTQHYYLSRLIWMRVFLKIADCVQALLFNQHHCRVFRVGGSEIFSPPLWKTSFRTSRKHILRIYGKSEKWKQSR